MDKAIAEHLMDFAATQQAIARRAWHKHQDEQSRLLCAAWARSVQELYAVAHPDERILTHATRYAE